MLFVCPFPNAGFTVDKSLFWSSLAMVFRSPFWLFPIGSFCTKTTVELRIFLVANRFILTLIFFGIPHLAGCQVHEVCLIGIRKGLCWRREVVAPKIRVHVLETEV